MLHNEEFHLHKIRLNVKTMTYYTTGVRKPPANVSNPILIEKYMRLTMEESTGVTVVHWSAIVEVLKRRDEFCSSYENMQLWAATSRVVWNYGYGCFARWRVASIERCNKCLRTIYFGNQARTAYQGRSMRLYRNVPSKWRKCWKLKNKLYIRCMQYGWAAAVKQRYRLIQCGYHWVYSFPVGTVQSEVMKETAISLPSRFTICALCVKDNEWRKRNTNNVRCEYKSNKQLHSARNALYGPCSSGTVLYGGALF